MKERNCLCCHEKLLGRTDKKFCDDHCRSSYNNQLNGFTNSKIRTVDHALKKNRRILMGFFSKKNEYTVLVIDREIQEMGFLFQFHTHIDVLDSGETCFYCYDYGIVPLGNKIKVVKAKV